MLRVLRRVVLALVAIVVVVAAAAGFLWATTPDARTVRGWSRLADMPVPRGETAVAVVSGRGRTRLVVAGGLATGVGRTVDTVSIYSSEDDAWGRGPPLPAPRNHAAAAAVDGTVFVTGGASGIGFRAEHNLWSMRLEEGKWDEGLPMPEGRWGHAMVSFAGRVYVLGGRGGTSRVLIYDPAIGWASGAAMPEPRDHLAAVVVGNEIWAIGGRSGGRLLRRVDVYDPVTDAWRSAPDLPIPMSAMAAAALASGVHVVGGEDPGPFGGVIDRHFVLETGWAAWRRAPKPVVAVHGVPGAGLDGRLVIAGGSRRNGGTSSLGWTGITQTFRPDS